MILAVCTPHGTPYVLGPWKDMLYKWLIVPPDTEFLSTYSLPVETARNNLVVEALNRGAENILFIDDDIFPIKQDSVMQLLKTKQNIVGGICRDKYDANRWVLFDGDPEFGGIQAVEATGCGFLLINRLVFETLAGDFALDQVEFFRWMGSTKAPNSEDATFCRMAKKYGFQTYVVPRIKCNHSGVGVSMYRGKLFPLIQKGKVYINGELL